jgi:signal transduction histidine kinase
MSEKKAIASLIIGIIGIISLTLNASLRGFLGNFIVEGIDYLVFYKKIPEWWGNFLEICYICLHFLFVFIFFLSIFGIFLGIKGAKSSKKTIAILGIILCSIDLIFSLYIGYWWPVFLTPR